MRTCTAGRWRKSANANGARSFAVEFGGRSASLLVQGADRPAGGAVVPRRRWIKARRVGHVDASAWIAAVSALVAVAAVCVSVRQAAPRADPYVVTLSVPKRLSTPHNASAPVALSRVAGAAWRRCTIVRLGRDYHAS